MDVPELVSIEDYDIHKAKLSASLRWLLAKAYNANVPEDLCEPFSDDQEGQVQLNQSIIEGLLSADIYVRACAAIWAVPASSFIGHQSVLEWLARHCVYVTDREESVVGVQDLQQPFKEASHVALIDALMTCVSAMRADVEHVVHAVRGLVPVFSASSELPASVDRALLWWVSKVGQALAAQRSSEEHLATLHLRDLKDLSDGAVLACVLHYYQPNLIPFKDIVLSSTLGIADSLHNLTLVAEACQLIKCWHLDIIDLFYLPDDLQPNFVVFLAELYHTLHSGLIMKPRPISSAFLSLSSHGTTTRVTNSQLLSNVSMDSELSINFDAATTISLNSSAAVSRQAKESLLPSFRQSAITSRSTESEKSRPPKSLDISQQSGNLNLVANKPSPDTPSDEYKTPSTEIAPSVACVGLGIGGKKTVSSQSYTVDNHRFHPTALTADDVAWEAASSSGSSDVELCKLHADTAADDDDGEPCDVCDEDDFLPHGFTRSGVGSGQLVTRSGGMKSSGGFTASASVKTSFAALKNQASKHEVFVAGVDVPQPRNTVIAPLPNQTTWKDAALRSANTSVRMSVDGNVGSDMTGVKIRLEERRQQMKHERKIAEVKAAREREQLGKQALLTVLSADLPPIVSSSASLSSQLRMTKASDKVGQMNLAYSNAGENKLPLDQVMSAESALKQHGRRDGDELRTTNTEADSSVDRNEVGRRAVEDFSQMERVGECADVQDSTAYSTSLNRLNSNLEQLRGQIMRLSLQQSGAVDDNKGTEGEPEIGLLSAAQYDPQGVAVFHGSGFGQPVPLAQQSALRSSHHVPSTSIPVFLPPWQSAPLVSPAQPSPYAPVLTAYPGVTYSTYTVPSSAASMHTMLPFSSPQLAFSTTTSYSSYSANINNNSGRLQTDSLAGLSGDGVQLDAAVRSSHNTYPPSCSGSVQGQYRPNIAVSNGALDEQEKGSVSATRDLVIENIDRNNLHPHDLSEDGLKDNFFVSLDTRNTPVRAKPQLTGRLKPANMQLVPTTIESVSDPQHHIASVVASPPVGFTVANSANLQTEIDEIDLRKKRLMQKQQKRLEEKERKLQQIETEMEEKKELERIKKDLQDTKKAEEKARKEAILQQHRQKKTGDGDTRAPEEESSKHPPAALTGVQRRAKAKVKSARPQSQPPVRGGAMHNDSLENLDQQMLMYPSSNVLAYGGLTHRRAASPETVRSGGRLQDSDEVTGGEVCQLDYTGPRLFVKPSQKSNRVIIINAVSHCCLAGTVNEKTKKEVLEELARSPANHFVILFRDFNQQFRGLYMYYPDTDDVIKIYGLGPKQITDQMFERFYKYNSGAKSFSQVMTTKHMSATIDAVTILGQFWKGKPFQKKPVNS